MHLQSLKVLRATVKEKMQLQETLRMYERMDRYMSSGQT